MDVAIIVLYLAVLAILGIYGFHRAHLVYLFWKHRDNRIRPPGALQGAAARDDPAADVQRDRTSPSACSRAWRASTTRRTSSRSRCSTTRTDETSEIVARKVAELRDARLRHRATSTAPTARASRPARSSRA